jgi:hypothetical protein
MKKSTSITYNIETCEGISTRELEYKDYVKNEKGEENLLHYKVKNVVDSEEIQELNETFNKISKLDNKIDETVGISSNNDDWKIHEYKNHKLDKAYIQGYDTIKFDIKSEMLEKYDKQYIKDN